MCVRDLLGSVPTLFLDLDTESGHPWTLRISSKYQGLQAGFVDFIEAYENVTASIEGNTLISDIFVLGFKSKIKRP